MKEWYYNEFKQVGIDFENEDEVAVYDEKYKASRNFDNEVSYIKNSIDLKPEHTVLEIGSGTSEISIRLAKQCHKVIAADVSETMLLYSKKKALALCINNIEFIHSGFLNLKLEPGSIDSAVSQIALHHLTDFWKSVALYNISKVLKKGGKFFLTDVAFGFDIDKYEESISSQLQKFKDFAGDKIVNEFIINIRDEYPTYEWVIENMLLKTGFSIDRIDHHNMLMASFICTKK